MISHQVLLISLLSLHLTFAAPCNPQRCKELAVCAEVFQLYDHEGESKCVYPLGHDWKKDCSTLPIWWQDESSATARVSSIKTYGKCVMLWSGTQCTGDNIIVMAESKATRNLSIAGFNDMTRSVSSCLKIDEISGASAPTCTDIQLFIGVNQTSYSKPKNDVTTISARLKEGLRLLLIPTGITVFNPLLDAFHYMLIVSNDIINIDQGKLLQASIDGRITRERVHESMNEITHWTEEIELLQNVTAGNITISKFQKIIEPAYDSISITLNGLGTTGAFMENPLISSPFLRAFTIIVFPILEAKLFFDPDRKDKICRQGNELIIILKVYENNSIIDRIKQIRETEYVNAIDLMTGNKVFHGGDPPASLNQMAWAKPVLNVCQRDWIVSIREGMRNFFSPVHQYARYFQVNNLNCSISEMRGSTNLTKAVNQ